MKKPVAKKSVSRAKKSSSSKPVNQPKRGLSSTAKLSPAQRRAMDKKGESNVRKFRDRTDPITNAPMLDAAGWNKDVNQLARYATAYKQAKTEKQAYDIAFKALKGWESQVEKKRKK